MMRSQSQYMSCSMVFIIGVIVVIHTVSIIVSASISTPWGNSNNHNRHSNHFFHSSSSIVPQQRRRQRRYQNRNAIIDLYQSEQQNEQQLFGSFNDLRGGGDDSNDNTVRSTTTILDDENNDLLLRNDSSSTSSTDIRGGGGRTTIPAATEIIGNDSDENNTESIDNNNKIPAIRGISSKTTIISSSSIPTWAFTDDNTNKANNSNKQTEFPSSSQNKMTTKAKTATATKLSSKISVKNYKKDTDVVEDGIDEIASGRNNIVSKVFRDSKLFHFLRSKSKSKLTHKSYAKKLKNRNHTNIRRKVMHALFGIGFSFINHIVPKKVFVPCMIVLSLSTLLMELLRYQDGYHWMNDTLHAVLGSSLRKHEMDGKFTGSFYYFTGVTITSLLFSKDCATIGIIQLALADPSASYFGRATRHIYWSRIENGFGGIGRNKGFLGFLGGALFCVPFNYRLLSLANKVTMTTTTASTVAVAATASCSINIPIIVASVLLGITGALADLCVPTPAVTLPSKIGNIGPIPPFHLDDNFVVPIFSAAVCSQIFKHYLHWSTSTQQLSTFLFI